MKVRLRERGVFRRNRRLARTLTTRHERWYCPSLSPNVSPTLNKTISFVGPVVLFVVVGGAAATGSGICSP